MLIALRGQSVTRVIKYYQLHSEHKLAIIKSFKADVSSVSPSLFTLTNG